MFERLQCIESSQYDSGTLMSGIRHIEKVDSTGRTQILCVGLFRGDLDKDRTVEERR